MTIPLIYKATHLTMAAIMALFFFNLVCPRGYEVDDIGSQFPNVEAAYLEARAAAIEMCIEIMREGDDPGRYQFEIVDHQRHFVMECPFSEVVRPSGFRAKASIHIRLA